MEKTTLLKIYENSNYIRITFIGNYAYKLNFLDNKIMRCKKEDINRIWITSNGRIETTW